jgi:hypothetical protein
MIGNPPFSIFMHQNLLRYALPHIAKKYPNFHVIPITPDGRLGAIEVGE